MSSKFECHYRQIFGGGLGQLSKYPLLEAVGIQMSSIFECHYGQIFCGWWHTTANRGNLTQRLRCFALRIKMLRCRRPLREFLLLLLNTYSANGTHLRDHCPKAKLQGGPQTAVIMICGLSRSYIDGSISDFRSVTYVWLGFFSHAWCAMICRKKSVKYWHEVRTPQIRGISVQGIRNFIDNADML